MDDRVQRIEERLNSVFRPDSLEVGDDSALHAGHEGAKSGGGHYTVNIVSPVFTGISTLERHRMIYDALADMMKGEIHALSIHAHDPTEL
ncbi:MAG: BolA family protein [Acidiferrobacterales bacterium]